MTETFQSAVINYLRYKMVVSLVWKSSTGSDLSSVQHLRDEPDRWLWVRPDGDHHVNMWRKDWTLQWSLKLTGCGVLLSVCFYYPESPAGTFKQGVPERDRQRERDTGVSRPTCWFYYSQIQLHHNKQEAQMFLPWTTREIWQSVRGQFTRWKLLSGAWSHKSSTSWMENDPYSEFSRDLHRAAGLTSQIETVGMKPVIGSPKVTETLTCSPVHWWRWHKQASSC